MLRFIAIALLAFQAAPAQDKKAEETYRAFEAKIAGAKSISATIKLDVQGRGTCTGLLLVGEGNKANVEFTPDVKDMEHMKLKGISNGTRLQRFDSDTYETETPKELSANLAKAFARMGAAGAGFLVAENKGELKKESGDVLTVSSFKDGPKEKVGDVEAVVLLYKLAFNENNKEETADMTLWLDPKTWLPLKRTMDMKMGADVARITETYSGIKLDEAIDAKKFEFPK